MIRDSLSHLLVNFDEMGLKPLEFSDCLLDSPYFRDSIHDHEKELDQTNDAIKSLIKECRTLLSALKNLSQAQASFSTTLENFKLRYIGEVDVQDELEYEDAFPCFAQIIEKVEEERARMLHHANIQLIEPLEKFRKEQIGKAKEEKKKFDKATEHVCQLLDNHSKVNPKKKEFALQEMDAQLEHELRNFREMSLGYVSKLQEVNEKKKFEFVEIMLAFMYGQSTFFHNGHDTFTDFRVYLTDLQYKLQTTRDRFDVTRQEAEDLKIKTIRKFNNGELHKEMYARQGYLFVYDRRKGGVLGTTWSKHYCMYQKENKILTMIPYSQTHGKLNTNTDTLVVASCVRKPTEGSDRRFLFEITGQDRNQPIILQSLTDADRVQWLDVMDGKEPIYMESSELVSQNEGVTTINEIGIEFVQKCLEGIEKRGLEDQGIYRIAGVSSKFNKLLMTGLDPKQLEKLDLISENSIWEVKTITSAMKQYFRTLSEPLFTFKYHHEFVQATKLDTQNRKIERLKELLQLIPEKSYVILNRLMYHLTLVATHKDVNLMQASNLAVVLGPTLMRPKEETMAAIMNIKYQTLVIETMIKEYDQLFPEGPPKSLSCKNSSSVPPSPSSERPSNKYKAPDPPSRPTIRPRVKNELDPASPRETSSTSSNDSISPCNSMKREHSNRASPLMPMQRQISNTNKGIRPPVPPAKPNSGGSIKRWPNVSQRPDTLLNKTHEDGDIVDFVEFRFTEPVSAFTSPSAAVAEEDESDESAEMKSRRISYAMALHTRINSVDIPQQPMVPRSRVSRPPSDSGPPVLPRRKEWKVRTLYNCVAENPAELSFNSGAIITSVRSSTEEGWLIGTLNGKIGLIPENYCEKFE